MDKPNNKRNSNTNLLENLTIDNFNVLDLPKILKLARENAILGFYETSLKKYNQALSLIQKRQNELSEPFLKQKWKMTELNVKSEIAQTKQILDLCKTLKNDYFDYSKRQIESEEDRQQKMRDDNIMVFDMNSNKKGGRGGPNINYFGKRPFSFSKNQNQGNDDPFENFKYDQINGLGKGVNDNVHPDYDDQALFSRGSNPRMINRKNSNIKPKEKKSYSNNNKNNFQKSNTSNMNEKSILNPLDKFNFNDTMSLSTYDDNMNVTNNANTTFMNEIRSYMKGNNMQSPNQNKNKPKNYDDRPIQSKWANYNNKNVNNFY